MKICRKCKSEFEGYYCKICKNNYNIKFRAENAEKIKSYNTEWYKANAEKVKENSLAWYKSNIKKAKESRAEWYKKNSETAKLNSIAWSKLNPQARKISRQNRRARKLLVGGKLSKGIISSLLKLQRGLCACCKTNLSKTNIHQDHIMPLARGGMNIDSNIQLLCQKCNLSKGAKHPIDFMQSRGFLL